MRLRTFEIQKKCVQKVKLFYFYKFTKKIFHCRMDAKTILWFLVYYSIFQYSSGTVLHIIFFNMNISKSLFAYVDFLYCLGIFMY